MTKNYIVFTDKGKAGILASSFEIDQGRLFFYLRQLGAGKTSNQLVAVFNNGCWNFVTEESKVDTTPPPKKLK
jgi:hypothetical protein